MTLICSISKCDQNLLGASHMNSNVPCVFPRIHRIFRWVKSLRSMWKFKCGLMSFYRKTRQDFNIPIQQSFKFSNINAKGFVFWFFEHCMFCLLSSTSDQACFRQSNKTSCWFSGMSYVDNQTKKELKNLTHMSFFTGFNSDT